MATLSEASATPGDLRIVQIVAASAQSSLKSRQTVGCGWREMVHMPLLGNVTNLELGLCQCRQVS